MQHSRLHRARPSAACTCRSNLPTRPDQLVAGLAEEIVDLPAQEGEREHGAERDDGDDQAVLDQRLALLIVTKTEPGVLQTHHGAVHDLDHSRTLPSLTTHLPTRSGTPD